MKEFKVTWRTMNTETGVHDVETDCEYATADNAQQAIEFMINHLADLAHIDQPENTYHEIEIDQEKQELTIDNWNYYGFKAIEE